MAREPIILTEQIIPPPALVRAGLEMLPAAIAARTRGGVRRKTSHMRESGMANVGTPQPSTATSDSPTSDATCCWRGCSNARYGWRGQAWARHAASANAAAASAILGQGRSLVASARRWH